VDVRILLDQIVEIIIPRIMEKMEEVVRIPPYHHHHGLEVVIIPVVEELFGIECVLMMIGEY
jgi:hypothetical protein